MTFGRALWLFLKIAIVVTVAVLLADRPGHVSITWLGYNIDLAVGTAMAVLVIFILVLYLLWRLWHIVRRAPIEYGVFRRNRRQAKGFRALTRGLVAVAAGDPVEAKRLARTAHGLLDKSPLALLLAAQAAQLEGDEAAAQRYFEALAKNPEASLLGLRGLATAALKRGDEDSAIRYSEQALQAHPYAEWAAETAHRLQVKLGRPAEESLKALIRAGTMSAKQGQHRRAVLLAERARQALLPETPGREGGENLGNADLDAALRSAREALKLDAAFVPARLILANLLTRMGKKREAAKLIEQDWDSNPHPLLARAYVEAEPGERPADRMKRLERLARQNPDHVETHRILGMTALAGGLWADARRHLEKLVEAERNSGGVSHATARAIALLEEGEHGGTAEGRATARRWLDQSAEAAADPAWICSTCGHPGEAGPASGNWQAVCPYCAAIDSYRWQRPALPTADLLMAPTGAPAAEPAAVPTVETPALPAEPPSPSPTRPEPPTPDSKLETQLTPSVDAARTIY
jgi:HemY protein